MAALFASLLPAFQDLFPLEDMLERSLGHTFSGYHVVVPRPARLQLPANPLDEIMKKLGGPRKARSDAQRCPAMVWMVWMVGLSTG